MWVRVLFGRTPVRCPSSVSNAIGAVERMQANGFFKVAQLSLRSAHLEVMVLVNNCNTGGVVTAVFQFSQAVEDYRHNLFFANVPNYSTHRSTLRLEALLKGAQPAGTVQGQSTIHHHCFFRAVS